MAITYIIYSKRLDRFYIGATTLSLTQRLDQHNSGHYSNRSFTAKSNDWEEFLSINTNGLKHALRLEQKIKKMKSRKFIMNLKKYPELLQKIHKETMN